MLFCFNWCYSLALERYILQPFIWSPFFSYGNSVPSSATKIPILLNHLSKSITTLSWECYYVREYARVHLVFLRHFMFAYSEIMWFINEGFGAWMKRLSFWILSSCAMLFNFTWHFIKTVLVVFGWRI